MQDTVLADELEEIIASLSARIERQEALLASISPCRSTEIAHHQQALANMYGAIYRLRLLSNGMRAQCPTGPLQ